MLESSLCLSLTPCDEIRTHTSENKTAKKMFLSNVVSADEWLKCFFRVLKSCNAFLDVM